MPRGEMEWKDIKWSTEEAEKAEKREETTNAIGRSDNNRLLLIHLYQ